MGAEKQVTVNDFFQALMNCWKKYPAAAGIMMIHDMIETMWNNVSNGTIRFKDGYVMIVIPKNSDTINPALLIDLLKKSGCTFDLYPFVSETMVGITTVPPKPAEPVPSTRISKEQMLEILAPNDGISIHSLVSLFCDFVHAHLRKSRDLRGSGSQLVMKIPYTDLTFIPRDLVSEVLRRASNQKYDLPCVRSTNFRHSVGEFIEITLVFDANI